jgi:hypothetical protein
MSKVNKKEFIELNNLFNPILLLKEIAYSVPFLNKLIYIATYVIKGIHELLIKYFFFFLKKYFYFLTFKYSFALKEGICYPCP